MQVGLSFKHPRQSDPFSISLTTLNQSSPPQTDEAQPVCVSGCLSYDKNVYSSPVNLPFSLFLFLNVLFLQPTESIIQNSIKMVTPHVYVQCVSLTCSESKDFIVEMCRHMGRRIYYWFRKSKHREGRY